MVYSAFNRDDESQIHYNVRILKYQPTKVLINGRLKDRANLSAGERAAVKNQEDIDRAREALRAAAKQEAQNRKLK